MRRAEVVTLGEALIRLTPPNFQRMTQASELQLFVGGSEANTAVGLARLGVPVRWLSRLPRQALGERVAQTLAAQGVDTSHIVWMDQARLGLYFWEEGVAPRPSQIIYDRQHSAASQLMPEDIPADLFPSTVPGHLHLTGITLALSETAKNTAIRAAQQARDAGWGISFDLNYRRNLWSPREARAACAPLLAMADLFIAPLRDVQTVLGVAETLTAEEATAVIADQLNCPQQTIVLTLGEAGALGRSPTGQVWHQAAVPTEVVDRIGSGDAFTAGLLYGLYFAPQARSLALGLCWGVAMAAIKRTIRGDLPLVDKAIVAQLGSSPVTAARDIR